MQRLIARCCSSRGLGRRQLDLLTGGGHHQSGGGLGALALGGAQMGKRRTIDAFFVPAAKRANGTGADADNGDQTEGVKKQQQAKAPTKGVPRSVAAAAAAARRAPAAAAPRT